MHPLMLQKIVKSCRARIAEGDCPTTPAFTVEQLEEAVAELAGIPRDMIDRLSKLAAFGEGPLYFEHADCDAILAALRCARSRWRMSECDQHTLFTLDEKPIPEACARLIIALRAEIESLRLTQRDVPRAEPVAWLKYRCGYGQRGAWLTISDKDALGAFPVYAAPPERSAAQRDDDARLLAAIEKKHPALVGHFRYAMTSESGEQKTTGKGD